MATESKTLISLALTANGVSAAMIDKIEESTRREVPETTRIFLELEPGL